MTSEFLAENRVQSDPSASYSPDLSPRNFFLFPKLKIQPRRIRFSNDDETLNILDNEIGKPKLRRLSKLF